MLYNVTFTTYVLKVKCFWNQFLIFNFQFSEIFFGRVVSGGFRRQKFGLGRVRWGFKLNRTQPSHPSSTFFELHVFSSFAGKLIRPKNLAW